MSFLGRLGWSEMLCSDVINSVLMQERQTGPLSACIEVGHVYTLENTEFYVQTLSSDKTPYNK